VRSYLNSTDFENFIRGKNQKGIILFSSYLYGGYDEWEEFPKLTWKVKHRKPETVVNDFYNLDQDIIKNEDAVDVFKLIVKNLTNSELVEFLTSRTSPVSWNLFTLFEFDEFWDIAYKSLDRNDLKILYQNLLYGISKSKFISKTEGFSIFLNRISKSLNSSEIHEIFTSRNILHSAVATNFVPFWNFFVSHSNKSEQIRVLRSQIDGECFGDAAMVPNDSCYYEPPLNILQIALIYRADIVRFIHNQYFDLNEVQELIFMGSNDFLTYLIIKNEIVYLKKISTWIKRTFKDDRVKLIEYLQKGIEPTNLNIFEYIRTFEPKSEVDMKPFFDLLTIEDADDFD
jgi:hypothetical protein